jgi:hypothetical protein
MYSFFVRSLASLLVLLAFIALTAPAARAHPDTLGAPDPYWQPVAGVGGATAVDGAATVSRGAPLPRLRRILIYGSGIAFVACAGSLLRALLATRRSRS